MLAGGGKGVKEKPGKGRKKGIQGEEAGEEEGDTYYDAMKKDMTDRAARTKVHLQELQSRQERERSPPPRVLTSRLSENLKTLERLGVLHHKARCC